MSKDLDEAFPVQWMFKGKKYGLSTTALCSRLRCYLTHLPFTRKFFPRFHDLMCGSLIIARIDNIAYGKEMMHEMRERGFEL